MNTIYLLWYRSLPVGDGDVSNSKCKHGGTYSSGISHGAVRRALLVPDGLLPGVVVKSVESASWVRMRKWITKMNARELT